MTEQVSDVQQEAEQAWKKWPQDGDYPSFEAGFEAAAESRDQRIQKLMLYVEHDRICASRLHDGYHKCDCGLAALLVDEEKG